MFTKVRFYPPEPSKKLLKNLNIFSILEMKNKKIPRTTNTTSSRIPRIWSFLLTLFAPVIIFSPDPYANSEPIPVTHIILLGLWGASIVGLLIGWFTERLGTFITIGALVIPEVLFIIVESRWNLNF